MTYTRHFKESETQSIYIYIISSESLLLLVLLCSSVFIYNIKLYYFYKTIQTQISILMLNIQMLRTNLI